MGWKHYQIVDHPQMRLRAPGWQGTVWYPSTNSSLQISIFQIHQVFNISYFPQFNLFFEKKTSLSQNAQKFTQNRQIEVNEMSREIWCRLKRDRDNGRKAAFSDVKTAFTCTPALKKYEILLKI